MQAIQDVLERRQVAIYFYAIAAAMAMALLAPAAAVPERLINATLALMLYATFLQVPLAELRGALRNFRFLAALLLANFAAIPLLVAVLYQALPADPLIRLGVLLVLLTPCIDYVVAFSHLGRADARLLLAATPMLLVVQMLLLPVYLGLFLGEAASSLIQAGPFLHAFLWLIVLPLALAAATQAWAAGSNAGRRAAAVLGLLPVPATALVLFVVIGAVAPQLGQAFDSALRVAPIYIAFAVIAPLIGWLAARWFGMQDAAGRAIAFSTGTRNSLVILPLALAVPGAIPVLPAVIVAQTTVELLSELVYIRAIARLGRTDTGSSGSS